MKKIVKTMSLTEAMQVINTNSQDFEEVLVASTILRRVMKNMQSVLDKADTLIRDKESFLRASDGEKEIVVQDKIGSQIYKLTTSHKYDIDKSKLDLSTLPSEFTETKVTFKLKEMKIAAAKGDTRGNINEALVEEEVSSVRTYEVDPVTFKMKK